MNRVEKAWAENNWMVRLPLSVRNGRIKEALLQLPRDLLPEEWDQFQRLLEVMKPGLVVDPSELEDAKFTGPVWTPDWLRRSYSDKFLTAENVR